MDIKPDMNNSPTNNSSARLPASTPITEKRVEDQSYDQKQAEGNEDTQETLELLERPLISTLPQIENMVSIPTFTWQKPMDRMGFTPTKLPVSIVAIAMSAATHLRGRGLASTDEMKALHDEIEALLNKTKKSARDCLAGMDANPDVYIPETVRKLQLVIYVREKIEIKGRHGIFQTFSIPSRRSEHYTISISSDSPSNCLPVFDYSISSVDWHQHCAGVKFPDDKECDCKQLY